MRLLELAVGRLAAFAEPGKHAAASQLEMLSDYRKLVAGKPLDIQEIKEALEAVLHRQDYSLGQLIIIAAYHNQSAEYADVLCRILASEGLGPMHENVCGLLGDIADEAAVPCLRRAVGSRFAWDQRLDVPRSALHALAEIDTAQAWAVISDIAANGPALLQGEAKDLLS